MAKLTQAELERHLWGAADILRGTVDAGDYKQYIFGLLFYKRLPKDEQSKWVDALLMIEGSRRLNQQTLATLYETKTVLMSDLLSGRVRVSL